ncbi:MAG: OmpA family protein [Crocinitomicaceae bacterium]|nr:OmpA family protein [Crocinitomicaceae bacterium]
MDMIKNYTFLVLISMMATVQAFAQGEDESCLPPSKKTVKLIEKAVNSSDVKTAVLTFNQAIDAEPDNAMAYYEYAMYAYKQAMKAYDINPNPTVGDKGMVKAAEMFQKTLDICADYHANCSYYLGVIKYSQDNMAEAIRYFKQFQSYKHTEPERYPNDHAKKLADVKSVLTKLESDQEMEAKEVPFSPSIVPNVSSSWDEYFPMISPDNELMFYTRKIDRKLKGDIQSNVVEEFTFSERKNAQSPFDSGKPFKYPFNDGTFQSYGAATMSVDNKEMILCACKDEMVDGQKYRNCDLYITRFERSGTGGNDFQWTPLENMGPGINSSRGWDAQPSLSADGNMLFYTTLRGGANPTRNDDIWVAYRNDKGEWGAGRPFDEINTAGKDKSPFLHQDSETLYFVSTVSDTRKGVGGLDIFYIRMEGEGKWSKPKNIGYPINSEADELGVFVSTDGNLAYYSSRQGGNWNIYSFELYEEARPKSVAIVKGELKDENGVPVENATIEIAYENSDKVEKIKVNGSDGKYTAIIKTEVKQDIMVTVKKEGSAFDSKLISKEDIASKKEFKGADLAVRELKEGSAYTINDILFATNSSALNSKSKFILKQFSSFLKENPSITIMVQGHTDDIGDDGANMELSKSRANEVKAYLQQLGIEAQRLSSKGFGETTPKVPNTTNENRAINRRTDFFIEKM